jgi:hypothetical protein
MHKSNKGGRSDRKKASRARLPADRDQREVDGESHDSGGGPTGRSDVEDGGKHGKIAACFRLVDPKLWIIARGQGIIVVERLITAAGVLTAAWVATLNHGRVPGLAAMAALTVLAIVQLVGNKATTGTKRRPDNLPYRQPKYLGGPEAK